MNETRPKRSSRERMLDAAEALLREGGLAAAGIKQVIEHSGAPIGSLYHHFPNGKKQMAREALLIHGEKARRLLEAAFATSDPLTDRIQTLFEGAATAFDQSGRYKSCAVGNLTLGLGKRDTELRQVCGEIFDGWVATIASQLPWPDERTRRSFAEMIVMTLEGAFVLSRGHQTGQPFIVAGRWLIAAAGHMGEVVG